MFLGLLAHSVDKSRRVLNPLNSPAFSFWSKVCGQAPSRRAPRSYPPDPSAALVKASSPATIPPRTQSDGENDLINRIACHQWLRRGALQTPNPLRPPNRRPNR
jgi:hypothetical protein